MSRPATLGQLRESGWESVPVKEEIRRNAIAKIQAGEPLFPGVLGYEDTVLPQLENALLAGHDVIFLGERGQAKTRMIRSLVGAARRVDADRRRLGDQRRPVPARCRSTPATSSREHGDDTPIEWVHRDTRFGEKLATPDTSIADLIGEVDPIKVAEGRYLSDELTLHYGLVPRTNRGIFAINELPDLAERIQVGLLNVLEERDVQVRGYKIRLPLDVLLVASANPEDYTNRGRIITPLKDRFGAQIRTHYPLEVETEVAIAKQEARPLDAPGIRVAVPEFMTEIVATLSHLARSEPAHQPALGRVGAAHRVELRDARGQRHPARAAPRRERRRAARQRPRGAGVVDGRQGRDRVARGGPRRADRRAPAAQRRADRVQGARRHRERCARCIGAFDGGTIVHAGDDVVSADEAKLVSDIPALRQPVAALTGGDESPAAVASAVEFILEGLHLSKRLNKDARRRPGHLPRPRLTSGAGSTFVASTPRSSRGRCGRDRTGRTARRSRGATRSCRRAVQWKKPRTSMPSSMARSTSPRQSRRYVARQSSSSVPMPHSAMRSGRSGWSSASRCSTSPKPALHGAYPIGPTSASAG